MSRTALARAYRPRNFSEVATQEHVSSTLRTAVQRGRVAHAYLFCGPRGVGKTTLARVLAMALNCPNRSAEGEPCGVCDSCERIWSGRTALDVVEIDAASNRGVEDARDLRERAMYAPSEHDRFKVYIIDEAHMLTREAWNALLKILEEPPPRVIFVFATTEPQKIQQAAPPILSRCQRFDFHRIATADLIRRMQEVLRAEGLEAGDDVLLPIAQKADGGMRDALSLLDQVLSFTEGPPNAGDVSRILGLVEDEIYLDLATIIGERRQSEVFPFVANLLARGYDLAEFYRGLADFLRALLMLKLNAGASEVRVDLRDRYEAAADRFATGDLLRMLAQVAELDTDGRFRKSSQQQILIELLLLRFTFLDRTVELEEVISALGGGESGGSGGGVGGGGSEGGGRSTGRTAGPTGRANRSAASAADRGGERADGPGDAAATAPTDEAAARAQSEGAAPVRSSVDLAAPESLVRNAGPYGSAVQVNDVRSAEPAHAVGLEDAPSASDEDTSSAPVAVAVAAPPSSPAPFDLPTVRRAWRAVLDERTHVPGGMGMLLRGADLHVAPGRVIEVGLPVGTPLEPISEARGRRSLETALAKRLGGSVTVSFVTTKSSAAAPGDRRITAESARQEELRRLLSEEPLLREAVTEWDLELLD